MRRIAGAIFTTLLLAYPAFARDGRRLVPAKTDFAGPSFKRAP
jgi:hypothetical protein